MDLWPHQERIIEQARNEVMKGRRRVLITSPTGSGKTRVLAWKLKSASDKGLVAWYVVHRRQLVHQTSRVLSSLGIEHTMVMAGEETDHSANIYVISRDTYLRRKDWMNLGEPALIVIDEAHIALGIQQQIAEDWPRAVILGYTATPLTLSGPAMGDVYESLVHGPTYTELIEGGYLVPPEYWEAVRVDTSGFRVSRATGEFVQKDLSNWVKKGEVIGSAIDSWRRIADGLPTVVFAPGVAASKYVAAKFNYAGIPAAHIDWSTPEEERERYLRMLASGEIKILSNADLLSEGYDMPEMRAVMMLAPTMSTARYLQRLGRALRIHPGKDKAIVIDHAGVLSRHGLHTDWERWTLETRGKRKERKEKKQLKKSEKSIVCPQCGFVFEKRDTCPQCGFKLGKSSNAKPLVEHPGEVVRAKGKHDYDPEAARAFYLDLAAYAREKGYKSGWVYHAFVKKYKRRPQWEWKNLPVPAKASETARNWAKYLQLRKIYGERKRKK